jgi:tetratricopeptide (TPR) repeat protein
VDNLLDAARRREVEVPDPETLQSIVARTEGNPFFTEEILRSLLEDRDLAPNDEEEDKARIPPDPLDLPYTVRAVLTMRIDRLPGAARRILQLASVVGRIFSYPVLVEIAQSPSTSASLDEPLLLLQRQQLIRERTRLPERTFIFEHQLTLEAAYATLLHRKRRVLHRRVAQALESLYPDRIETMLGRLAHHWEEAGDADRAVAYLQRAGHQAASQYANVEAVDFFTRALRLLDPTDDERRYAILLARERVYNLQGNRQAQDRDLDTLATLADRSGDPDKQAEIAIRRTQWMAWQKDHTTTMEMAQLALKLAKLTGNTRIEILSHLHIGRAITQLSGSEPEEIEAHYEEALSLAQSAHLRALEAQVLRQYGLWVANDLERDWARMLQDALEIYREVGDRGREGWMLNALGAVYRKFEDLDRARDFLEQGLKLEREVGNRMEEGWSHLNLGLTATWQGRFEDAHAHIENAFICARETETIAVEGLAYLFQSELLAALGAYGKAEIANNTFLTLPVERSLVTHRILHRILQGLIAYHRGDNQAALLGTERALAIIENSGSHRKRDNFLWLQFRALTIRGHAQVAMGEFNAATRDYQEALSIRLLPTTVAITNDARAGLARVAMRRGDLPGAMAQVKVILDYLANRSLDGTIEPLRILLTCYRVLDAVDDPRADGILETAHTLLMQRADTVEDDTLRFSYLDNVRAHRKIRRLWTT